MTERFLGMHWREVSGCWLRGVAGNHEYLRELSVWTINWQKINLLRSKTTKFDSKFHKKMWTSPELLYWTFFKNLWYMLLWRLTLSLQEWTDSIMHVVYESSCCEEWYSDIGFHLWNYHKIAMMATYGGGFIGYPDITVKKVSLKLEHEKIGR